MISLLRRISLRSSFTKISELTPCHLLLASYNHCPTSSLRQFHYLTNMKRESKRSLKPSPSPPKRKASSTVDDNGTKYSDKHFGYGQFQPIDEDGFKEFLGDIKEAKHQHADSIENYDFNEKRLRCVNGISIKESDDYRGSYRGVSYWMFRDQRVDDNWALICAQKFALKHKCPLYVTFYLMSHYSFAGTRQYEFMLSGLQQVEKQCQRLGIQFHLELGYAKDLYVDYCETNKIDLVIADFCPLRDPLSWLEDAGRNLKTVNIPLYQVDAHNIVPCWVASNKQEFAARTIRPKIHFHLKEFLTEIPELEKHPYLPESESVPVDWDAAWAHLKIDVSIKPVSWAKPGTLNAYRMLYEFITQRLKHYDEDRNDPTKNGCSNMSPYFHFGQISVQRTILAVTNKKVKAKAAKGVDAFVEEAVVRRELSDNFCFYQPDYDNINGAPDWGKKNTEAHRKEKREFVYSQEEFQFAKTHDKIWNAAQIQLLTEGKMHGYMRMYWAKKILEWSSSAEEALKIAIFLNDKYELDGRDPNGYVGIMWSVVGTHDRPWVERPVVGKVRWMSASGCERKFDCPKYIRYYSSYDE